MFIANTFARKYWWVILFACACVTFAACLTFANAQNAATSFKITDVSNIRFGVNAASETRIVLDLTGDVKYRVTPEQTENGDKIIAIELANTKFFMAGAGSTQGQGKAIGALSVFQYREIPAAELPQGEVAGEIVRARIEFEVAQTAIPVKVFMLDAKAAGQNYRLVVDLKPVSEREFMKELGLSRGTLWPSAKKEVLTSQLVQPEKPVEQELLGATEEFVPTPAMKPVPASGAAKAKKPVTQIPAALKDIILTDNKLPVPRLNPRRSGGYTIAIDAGHGGKDPGASGQNGTAEKAVTLAAAKTLKNILIARGYRVVMTRDGDTFLDLDGRAKKARASDVHLFLSIHADALDDSEVRGGSVYTVSEEGAKRIRGEVRAQGDFGIGDFKMSKEENAVDDILLDLAQKEAKSASENFANILASNMRRTIPMVKNTHRTRDLKVLLAPNVPAVLLELAFISNEKDEKNLNSRIWRKNAMVAVADSIDTYFRESPPKHARVSAPSVQGGQ